MLYATHAEIDLSAIGANLVAIREHCGQARVMACVKANAYGHGAVPVSRYLEQFGLADWLAVATVPEGIELREAGIRLPILKLSQAFPEELAAAIEHDIDLPVVDAETIAAVAAAAQARRGRARVHLAIDTGMRRIGCEPGQAAELAALIAAHPELELIGIFTHLPVSDSVQGVEFTRAELALFTTLTRRIQQDRAAAGLPPVPLVHAANSGAILGHDLSGTDLVRPGIIAYGCYPDPTSPRTIPLRQALSLRSRVSFVKQVQAGQSVGYGRTWLAPVDTWLATIPVGYADGFSRLNSNRGRVLIKGLSYPIVGRVCMDQLMVDLGPGEPAVAVGDAVTLIGSDGEATISTDEVAGLMGTINYEVSCLITPRVTRVYRD